MPPAKASAPMFGTVAVSLYSAPSHPHTQWPQGFPLHLVPLLAADMKHKADGTTEAYLNPTVLSIALRPNSSGVPTSQHRLGILGIFQLRGAIFSQTNPARGNTLALLRGDFLQHVPLAKPIAFPPSGSAPCRSDPATTRGAEPGPRSLLQGASLWCGASPSAPYIPPCQDSEGVRRYGQELGAACCGAFGSREGPQGFT